MTGKPKDNEDDIYQKVRANKTSSKLRQRTLTNRNSNSKTITMAFITFLKHASICIKNVDGIQMCPYILFCIAYVSPQHDIYSA